MWFIQHPGTIPSPQSQQVVASSSGRSRHQQHLLGSKQQLPLDMISTSRYLQGCILTWKLAISQNPPILSAPPPPHISATAERRVFFKKTTLRLLQEIMMTPTALGKGTKPLPNWNQTNQMVSRILEVTCMYMPHHQHSQQRGRPGPLSSRGKGHTMLAHATCNSSLPSSPVLG